jgi:hypothetical protein
VVNPPTCGIHHILHAALIDYGIGSFVDIASEFCPWQPLRYAYTIGGIVS